MHLNGAKVTHQQQAWHIDFFGDAGEQLTVRLPDAAALSEEDAIDCARKMMVQLTAFGTRGGVPSLNRYDSLSNGNFDDDEQPSGMKH
ncbi:hypothetical protein EV281_10948 [Rhizobium sp. BK418]|nr:hypothetical protein [Rhizobium sp. BK418]TCR98241.1 hypothetical protein EV281_10948 [Rhizobium sp. BK418]